MLIHNIIMESILTIEQLNKCFVNNIPILFIKKYPEYELRKEGLITSIDFMTKLILVRVEEGIFYKVNFDDVTIYKI
jgi:hypothetical protein